MILAEVKPGQKFYMLNYVSVYIRPFTHRQTLEVKHVRATEPYAHDFNDPEQLHLPIVDLATGCLSWMDRNKPIRLLKYFNLPNDK